MRWREEDTCLFVKLYLKNENLYDPKNDFYRSKERREESYKKISAEFSALTGINLHELEIKVKIKSLRSTYSQELAKIKDRSRPDFTYKPNMKWFAEWHKKCFSPSSKYNSIDISNIQNENSDTEQIEENSSNGEPSDSNWPDYKQDTENETEDYTPSIPTKFKKRKIKKELANIEYLELNPTHNLEMESEPYQKDDEFDMYGKYIASQLRKLSTPRAIRLKLKIHSLVHEERLADFVEK